MLVNSISSAKTHLSGIVASGEVSYLTKNGKVAAVIVPYEEYQKISQIVEEREHKRLIQIAEEALENPENGLTLEEFEGKINEGV